MNNNPHPLRLLVGKTLTDARVLLDQYRVHNVRVTVRDGQRLAVIQNYDQDRCNLEIVGGTIVSATHDSGAAFPDDMCMQLRGSWQPLPRVRFYYN